MISILLASLSAFSLAKDAPSSNSFTAGIKFYEVSLESQTQKLIEQAYIEIFQSPLKNQLCAISNKASYWQTYLGLNLDTAEKVSSFCGFQLINQFPRPKYKIPNRFPDFPFHGTLKPKRYFISWDENQESDVHSWTDSNNSTYLFLDNQTSLEELKLILAHELAISFDSKNNLTFMAFNYLEGIGPTFEYYDYEGLPISNANEAILYIGQLSYVFNTLAVQKYAQVTAVMRAVNIERILQGQEPISSQNNQSCQKEFLEVLNFFKKYPDQSKVSDNELSYWESYSRDYDEKYKLKSENDEKILLEWIFNQRLPIKNQPELCRYLATPLLDGVRNNLFTSGPRPRVTGGTGASKASEKIETRVILQSLSEDYRKKLIFENEKSQLPYRLDNFIKLDLSTKGQQP